MTISSAKIEPAYVLDTVALIRHLTEHRKLGRQAKAIFSAAEHGDTQLIISAVVIAELYSIHRKHNLFDDFREVYVDVRSRPQFQFVVFSSDDVLDYMKNDFMVDIFDNIIAKPLAETYLTNAVGWDG